MFDITLAKDSHLTGNKLKKAIDDYHYLTPGTTKRVKSKPLEDTQPEQDGFSYEQDDRIDRHKIGTKIYKHFGDKLYAGEVASYDD